MTVAMEIAQLIAPEVSHLDLERLCGRAKRIRLLMGVKSRLEGECLTPQKLTTSTAKTQISWT